MRRRFLIAIGVVLAATLGWVTVAGAVVQYVRVGGTDRFDTADVLAHTQLTPPVSTVFIASGDGFADALAASAAAAHVGGAVLLTHATSLPDGTVAEIKELKPSKVYVVGGPATISDAVKAAVTTAATSVVPGATVLRVGASVGTRYDTSAALAQAVFSGTVPAVYVASGETFPDSLTGSAAAGALGGPVLLMPPTGQFPQSFATELGALAPKKVVLLGGFSTVGELQKANLDSVTGVTSTRLSGTDRYGTAIAVAKDAFPNGVDSIYLTSGENYPDGLAAGAIAGSRHVPLLLTKKDCLPQAVANEITQLNPSQVFVVGGTGSVSYPVDSPPPICS